MWQDTGARYGNKMPDRKASKREQSLQSEEVIGQSACVEFRLAPSRMVVPHPVCGALGLPLDWTTFERSPAQPFRPPLKNHSAPAVVPIHPGQGITAAIRLFGPNWTSAKRKRRG